MYDDDDDDDCDRVGTLLDIDGRDGLLLGVALGYDPPIRPPDMAASAFVIGRKKVSAISAVAAAVANCARVHTRAAIVLPLLTFFFSFLPSLLFFLLLLTGSNRLCNIETRTGVIVFDGVVRFCLLLTVITSSLLSTTDVAGVSIIVS